VYDVIDIFMDTPSERAACDKMATRGRRRPSLASSADETSSLYFGYLWVLLQRPPFILHLSYERPHMESEWNCRQFRTRMLTESGSSTHITLSGPIEQYQTHILTRIWVWRSQARI